MRKLIAALSLALATAAAAQQARDAPGATITGTIICADTGRPARFAHVILYSAVPPTPDAKASSVTHSAPATADVDGRFSVEDVSPGTYYVRVSMPGYIDPSASFTTSELQSADAETRARVAAKVPMLTIMGAESTRLNLTIDRAAAISGRILFDDGSPAAGWVVSIHHPAAPGAKYDALSSIFVGSTDDRGDFRVPGIPPGSYILHAQYQNAFFMAAGSLVEAAQGFSMSLYNGSVSRAADAKPLTVTAGQELSGIDMNVPLHSLHSISGAVTAKSDGHAVTNGSVTLTSPDDPSLSLTAGITGGAFTFYYVPANTTYTIQVDGYDSIPADPRMPVRTINGVQIRPSPTRYRYGPVATTVHLGDMDIDNITLALPETTNQGDWIASPVTIQ